MTYELPQLPYEYNALEPHIDEQTMRIHHDKHHAAYCDKFNAALQSYPQWFEKTPEMILQELYNLPDDIELAVRNNGGGYVNHCFFWDCMSPQGGGEPTGEIGEAILEKWGTFEKFKEEFSNAALTRFGSGWAWLVLDGRDLEIISTANQDSPLTDGKVPLLNLDVWEHSFYLKWQNRKPEYIKAWWNVVNWEKVNEHFTKALEE